MPSSILGAIFKTTFSLIFSIFKYVLQFARWFYLTLLPFILQYIGIPLFALGIILALAFAGGTMVFTIAFFIFMFFFIKGTIFESTP